MLIKSRKISFRYKLNDLCSIPIYLFFFISPLGLIARDLMPFEISPNLFPAGIIVFIFVIFLRLNAKANINVGMVLLYICIMFISLYKGQNVHSIIISHIGYFLIALLISNYKYGEVEVRSFLKVYLYSLTFVVILSFLELFTSIQIIEESLITKWAGVSLIKGPFENQNAFATFLMIGILCISECFSQTGLFSRIFKWLIFILLFSALVLTAGRSAMLGLLFGLFIQQSLIFAKKDKRAIGKVIFGWGTMAIIFAFVTISYFDLLFLNDLLAQKSDSTNYRLEAFNLFINIFLENPFFGIGYQNFWHETEAMFGFKMGIHNTFLGILIDFGLFAFLIFAYLFYRSFVNIFLKLKSGNIDLKFSHSILAIITSIFIHGQFHEIQVNTIIWLILLLAIFFPNKSDKRNKLVIS